MAAAAQNLTPVTLELGGKSPAIVHPDYDLATAVQRIVRGKLLNAGQTCIAPDYALVQRGQVEPFLRQFREVTGRLYPRLLDNPDYTSIINSRHYERLSGLVDDARSKGARIETVDPAGELGGSLGSPQSRKMAPTALASVTDEMAVMREEIFGPLLPVVPYDTLDDAIAYVNARPRPGVTVNDTLCISPRRSCPSAASAPAAWAAITAATALPPSATPKACSCKGPSR